MMGKCRKSKLTTHKSKVLSRWRKYFEDLLNLIEGNWRDNTEEEKLQRARKKCKDEKCGSCCKRAEEISQLLYEGKERSPFSFELILSSGYLRRKRYEWEFVYIYKLPWWQLPRKRYCQNLGRCARRRKLKTNIRSVRCWVVSLHSENEWRKWWYIYDIPIKEEIFIHWCQSRCVARQSNHISVI